MQAGMSQRSRGFFRAEKPTVDLLYRVPVVYPFNGVVHYSRQKHARLLRTFFPRKGKTS